MMRGSAIGVVDYGMGNLRSVSKALESLGFPTLVSGDPKDLSSCRGIVFPGVGAFRDCMGNVVRQGLLPRTTDLTDTLLAGNDLILSLLDDIAKKIYSWFHNGWR